MSEPEPAMVTREELIRIADALGFYSVAEAEMALITKGEIGVRIDAERRKTDKLWTKTLAFLGTGKEQPGR